MTFTAKCSIIIFDRSEFSFFGARFWFGNIESKDGEEKMEIFLIVIFALLVLAIQLFIADRFEKVAFMKGYDKSVHAFAMCFWLGLIGCVYVAALPTKTKASAKTEEGPNEEGQNQTKTPTAAPGKANFYRCQSIVVTNKCSSGNCIMCATSHLSLKHCKITSEIGTREIPICDSCIRKFEDNSGML